MLTRSGIVVFVLLLLFSIEDYGQVVNNSSPTNQSMYNTDVFIVDLKMDSLFSEKRIRINFGKNNKCFTLHRITIEKVYYIADSSYLNRRDLLGAKYVLIPCRMDVPSGSHLFASIYATTKDGVFIWSRLLSKKDIDLKKIWYSSIVRNVEINSRKLEKCLLKDKH